MPLIRTHLSNVNFVACFKADIVSMPPQLKLHLHFTKSPKHDNIYILCLFMPEEHLSDIINILACSKADIYSPCSKM